MSQHTLARPYAKAIFDQAQQANALDDWQAFLHAIARVVRDARVKPLLHHPAISQRELITFIEEVCGVPVGEPQQRLLQLLARYHRLGALPEITELYDNYKAQAQGTLDVQVRAAVELSSQMQTRLAAALGKRFQRQVSVTSEVDETLIGGAVIHAGDWVMDGSLRGKLKRLRDNLLQ